MLDHIPTHRQGLPAADFALDPRPRVALLVLGMHRSGTSALTRAISICGPALPARQIESAADNETGFWEPREIVALHDEALAAAGSAWDDVLEINPSWFESKTAAVLRQRLAAAITEDYSNATQIVIKDPRLCYLLPLWRPVLDKLGIEPRIVIALRHPFEVAASLAARQKFSTGRSLALWLRHLLAAEHCTRDLARHFVTYDALLSDPVATLSRLGETLRLAWHPLPATAKAELEDFVSTHRRHHAISTRERNLLDSVNATVGAAWDWAASAAGVTANDDPAQLDTIAARLSAGASLYAPVISEQKIKLEEARCEAAKLRAQLASNAAEAATDLDGVRHVVARLETQIADDAARAAIELAGVRRESARLRTQLANYAARAAGRINEARYEATVLRGQLANYAARAANDINGARYEVTVLRAQLADDAAQASKSLDEARCQVTELRTQLAANRIRATNTLNEARREIAELRKQLDAIRHSTSWRISSRIRTTVDNMPQHQRLLMRRILKALYWTVTPHRMPARLAFLKARRRAEDLQDRAAACRPEIASPQPARPDANDLVYVPATPGSDGVDFDPTFYSFVYDLGSIPPSKAYKDYLSRGPEAVAYSSILGVSTAMAGRIAANRERSTPGRDSVSIGIVTYGNTFEQIDRIIKSAQIAVARCDQTVSATIRILDNGSPYDPSDLPEGIRFVLSAKNIGFGEGHNRLMDMAFAEGADLYIAANPDGAFHVECIKHLVDTHRAKEGRALVEALQFPEEHPKYYDPVSFRTPWASGACLLIPREIWEATGGFDANIFLYCEDVDLSWMARRAGFEALTCPRALFWHDLSDRKEEAWRTQELLLASRYLAYKWDNRAFQQWTEQLLVERGMALSKHDLPPLDDLPVIRDSAGIPDFEREFHYAMVRWA